MKHVIRYLLEGDGTVPKFVVNGGHFCSDEEMVGISVDDAKRHLPSTVVKLSKAELVSRIEELCKKSDDSPLTPEEATAMADAWLAQNDMADYE